MNPSTLLICGVGAISFSSRRATSSPAMTNIRGRRLRQRIGDHGEPRPSSRDGGDRSVGDRGTTVLSGLDQGAHHRRGRLDLHRSHERSSKARVGRSTPNDSQLDLLSGLTADLPDRLRNAMAVRRLFGTVLSVTCSLLAGLASHPMSAASFRPSARRHGSAGPLVMTAISAGRSEAAGRPSTRCLLDKRHVHLPASHGRRIIAVTGEPSAPWPRRLLASLADETPRGALDVRSPEPLGVTRLRMLRRRRPCPLAANPHFRHRFARNACCAKGAFTRSSRQSG